ncbi:hypothetical protein NQZ68_025580 [Dissostichus eleginoides]|nr:hypothetical protein NQZ68_025580 [Dissostichus eleginoides]
MDYEPFTKRLQQAMVRRRNQRPWWSDALYWSLFSTDLGSALGAKVTSSTGTLPSSVTSTGFAHPIFSPSTVHPLSYFFPPSRSLWECDALRISEIRSLQVQQQKSDHDASFLLTDGERDNRPSHNLHQQQLSSEKERKREREQE